MTVSDSRKCIDNLSVIDSFDAFPDYLRFKSSVDDFLRTICIYRFLTF